jgi:hypothetical protein
MRLMKLMFFRASFLKHKIIKNIKITLKKCVAYPQEDFLFTKFIKCFRSNLLNKWKKDFQLNLRPLQVYLFGLTVLISPKNR